MLRARIPPPPRLPEMFRLEEVLDFPAEEVHVVAVTKAAFNEAISAQTFEISGNFVPTVHAYETCLVDIVVRRAGRHRFVTLIQRKPTGNASTQDTGEHGKVVAVVRRKEYTLLPCFV